MTRSIACLLAIALLAPATAAADDEGYKGRSAAEWKLLLSGTGANAAREELEKGGLPAARVCVAILEGLEPLEVPPLEVYDVLEEIGTAAEELLPNLIQIYRAGHSMVTGRPLVRAMVAVGRNRKELEKALKWGLGHEFHWVRYPSACALAELGLQDGRALNVLINEILPWSDQYELYFACRAISRIGEPAKAAVKNLTLCVGHDSEFVRFAALQALIDVGEKGHEQIERLVLNSKLDVQVVSAIWLGAQRGKSRSAVKNLRKLLREGYHEEGRAAAALALGMIGKDADSAADDLVGALDDDSEIVRSFAGQALTMIGEKGETKLRHALDSTNKRVVEQATAAIPHLETKGDRVVETLVGLLARPRHAAGAIEALGRMGTEVVPRLVEALADTRAPVRAGATRALGMIAGGAKEAVPALEKLEQDPDEDVRKEARSALHWIRTSD